MYLVRSYAVDTRSALLQDKSLDNHNLKQHFLNRFGMEDFENKLKRFTELNLNLLGVPEEYYNLLISIIEAYCCGQYYPAITGAGALGERILNRLILKTRSYFKTSPHYKNVWKSKSFDNWDKVIPVLRDWQIINDEVRDLFNKLKTYRNAAIHYNDGYDFEKNAYDAVELLVTIIDKQFNYLNRKDLLWVFNSPGEVLVRSDMLDNPFVIEFILPHCLVITPFSVPNMDSVHITKHNINILAPISDEDFIELRNNKHLPSS